MYLDDLDCSGNEENLLQCMTDSRASHDCTHEEDAGVKCGGMYPTFFLFCHLYTSTMGVACPFSLLQWSEACV